jgi:hypothetical protein
MAKDDGKCDGKHYILHSSTIEVWNNLLITRHRFQRNVEATQSISINIRGSFDINKLRAKLFNE